MAHLNGMLLSSTNPDRLGAWYAATLDPDRDEQMDKYRLLTFGAFYLLIDQRDDISDTSPEPGRIILNFDVEDARAVVERLEESGAEWVAPLEDRDGSLFATVGDPDGNYVQVIEMSAEARAAMSEQPE